MVKTDALVLTPLFSQHCPRLRLENFEPTKYKLQVSSDALKLIAYLRILLSCPPKKFT